MPLYDVTSLDSPQVLKYAYDEATQSLRTTASASLNPTGDISVIIDNTTDSIAVGTSAQLFTGTTVGGDFGLDVNIIGGSVSGTLNPVGLRNTLSTTAMIVTDSPQKVPPFPDSQRNSMSVRVWSATPVYFGPSGVGVLRTDPNPGYPKIQFEELVVDIQANPNVDLWAVCASGATSELRIMEIG